MFNITALTERHSDYGFWYELSGELLRNIENDEALIVNGFLSILIRTMEGKSTAEYEETVRQYLPSLSGKLYEKAIDMLYGDIRLSQVLTLANEIYLQKKTEDSITVAAYVIATSIATALHVPKGGEESIPKRLDTVKCVIEKNLSNVCEEAFQLLQKEL